MLDSVEKTISRYIMLVPGDRCGVAVSGGADSIALLHALHSLAPRWGLHLEVLHLNHQLRGDESEADAEFVRCTSERLGVPVHLASVDVRALGGNLEEAAREARLRFFAEMAEQHQLRRIATGHTRSDQAETVLFRLLRGSGPQGLAGILPLTAEGLIRPLLQVSRPEVEAWLRARGIAWREDSSNLDRAFARNRIRRELLPQLARDWNPNLEQALARLAEIVRDEEAWWATQMPGAPILSAEGLRGMHPALARRFLRAACARWGETPGFEALESIRALAAETEGSGRLSLPGLDVMRSFDAIRIAPRQTEPVERFWEFPITRPGLFTTPAGRFLIESESTLPQPMVLRNWRPGDRLAGDLLKQSFQVARIPLWERRDWPVLECAGRIVWTRRFAPLDEANSFRITDLEGGSEGGESGYNEAST